MNIADQALDGFDVPLKYTVKTEAGRFDLGSNIGIFNHSTPVDVPGDPRQETVGKSTVFNGTIPRWQSYTTAEFTRGSYAGFLGWRSIPSLIDDEDGANIGKFNTIDASVSYTFGAKNKWMSGAKVSLGVDNVFTKFGPQDPTIFSDSNVDTATYGAMGRFIYLDVKFKF